MLVECRMRQHLLVGQLADVLPLDTDVRLLGHLRIIEHLVIVGRRYEDAYER